MTEPIFKIQNVVKRYGEHIILDNISFEIKKGEIFGIIGASGSGKTTLLQTIIGFLRPDHGDVLFRFEHLLDFQKAMTFRSVFKKQQAVKKIYGFASQTPSFYKDLTLRENLEYFGSLYNLSHDALQTNIDTLLNLMDLKHYENLLAKNLSGGMERRLDIACSLIHDPEVLVLDEPTADLDPILREHIWTLIKKINKKGTTIILASHHLTELENLCSRIAIIKDKAIVDVGSPDSIKNKYSKIQEVSIETYPGNYSKILSKISKGLIKSHEIKGAVLVMFTDKPQKVFHELFQILENLKEEVIDMKIGRPTLDDIFVSLSKDKKDEIYKNNQKKS
ncbi:MAG: ABC transporter ATP-binding protein [Nanoarchaeota archaeon]|nr:ABC transporter ATP-binding protein [Nanoarchaeota archaeon]MBU1269284.1 ABC transporter ATP-binding protein [Nanoarchaeota archaeon]MBU1603779.1 ABC transporter ATP-binding protein [Nanoarchaeota archaeon]MBU2443904.1 ABC transporter ATP-binding protein [Nanoarchaeota archaeon]